MLLSLLSFFDDKLNLTPRARLVFQFAAALVIVVFNLPGISLRVPFCTHLDIRSLIFSCLLVLLISVFIVSTANFYNFMDGINGIAGITGVAGVRTARSFCGLNANTTGLTLSAVCASVACLGFLPLNIPMARVFMGDVGSILLGFVFAAYVITLSHNLTN